MHSARSIRLGLLTLVLGALQAQACPWNAAFVSAEAKAKAPEAFDGIDREMTVPAIMARLGPAARDIGSGLHVLAWDVEDGRTFLVSTPDGCGKPVNAGFRPRAADSSPEPDRRRRQGQY